MACASSKDAVSALLDGYSDPIQWLVVASFQLGLAVQQTGLGHRICTYLLKLTTSSDSTSTNPIPIAYTLLVCEYLLALFIPSNTARGAGIMSPIISSLATSSSPALFDFWHLLGAHANILSAAAHMTGTAGGPMIARMLNTYLDMDIRPVQWSVGALGPWVACAAGLPWVVAWLLGVDLRRTGGGGRGEDQQVQEVDADEEAQPLVAADAGTSAHTITTTTPPGSPMSPISYLSTSSSSSSSSDPCASPAHASFTPAQTNAQILLVAILVPTLTLWSFSPLDPSAPAFLSLVLLLLLRILPLSAILAHTQAWDTFLWLGGFLTLSTQLEWAGVTQVLGAGLASILPKYAGPAMLVAAMVNMVSMYLFSSLTAHAAVVAPPVLAAVAHAITSGDQDENARVPWAVGMCMAMTLVLGGLLTPYSTGSVAMYAGKSTLSARRWVHIGAVVGGLAVGAGVIGVGAAGWWWIIGWWASEGTVVV
ncbi:Sodium/sulfate symporter [Catenaria anguillulae PL171]|uniref:Sodium/sulfate symporter n=1 Tax=Catenaria anguillulae PL171 TaxID=765915 RepID=A0A1Y2H6U6_9FUNG|nr:Sodium/sulfate symporter [Catenaria anguillulae PL171]